MHFCHAREKINAIRFSPDGGTLAAASGDGNIYLYNVKGDGKKLSKKSVLHHHSAVKNFDFSSSSKFLQSADFQNELHYWYRDSGTKIENMKSMRDTAWSTWTCHVGWCVNGCQDRADIIQSFSRSHGKNLICIANDDGTLSIYRYPYCSDTQIEKTFSGHGVSVSNAKFALKDSYLISIGGSDCCVIQWKVEYEEEDEQPPTTATKVYRRTHNVFSAESL